jgi:hypothetical protein
VTSIDKGEDTLKTKAAVDLSTELPTYRRNLLLPSTGRKVPWRQSQQVLPKRIVGNFLPNSVMSHPRVPEDSEDSTPTTVELSPLARHA